MATITLEITPELEKKLQSRAAEQGRDIASVALEIVEKAFLLKPKSDEAGDLTHEQRWHELEAWVKTLPKVDVVLDVSRESIYEGRGE